MTLGRTIVRLKKRIPLPPLTLLLGCALLISTPAQTNLQPSTVELPIHMRHGDLLVETRVNGSEPLAFKLDTGFGITTINPERVESLKLNRVGRMTIQGIAGEERADTFDKAVFDFGGMKYEPR